MPRHRNPDTGEIVDMPSYEDRNEADRHAAADLDEPPTVPPGRLPSAPQATEERKAVDAEADRALRPGEEPGPASPALLYDDPPSRLDVDFGTGRSGGARLAQGGDVSAGPVGASGAATGGSPAPDAEAPKGGPVVGWVVVVDGPGKGHARALGYGTNPLGRGADARVRLDFGDDRISRQAHAIVTYDPRGRKFYLQHGGGTNLTYLDGAYVPQPTVLEGMQHIRIGATTLRFVPFCGPDFDWQDAGEA